MLDFHMNILSALKKGNINVGLSRKDHCNLKKGNISVRLQKENPHRIKKGQYKC